MVRPRPLQRSDSARVKAVTSVPQLLFFARRGDPTLLASLGGRTKAGSRVLHPHPCCDRRTSRYGQSTNRYHPPRSRNTSGQSAWWFARMLMTGKEYLQSIRDSRVIYVGKERVKDQTTHPAFADGARTYAALFDMKLDPAVRDLMTFEEDGECYSMYYLQPRSQEDLRRRNRAHRKIADFC